MENNYSYSKKLLYFVYPLNIYAFSKFLFDKYVNWVINNAKVKIVELRYFNVYGPHENHKEKMASVIFHFHIQILKVKKNKLI